MCMSAATMTTATVLHWTTESLVYVCRVSAIRFSAAGLSPPCFPLTGSWKPPFCTGQKNIMTTNIAVVAECLKYEADEYKKRYDEIHSTLFFFYRCVAIPSYVKLLFVSFSFQSNRFVFPAIPNPVHQHTQQSIQNDCCPRLHVPCYRFITINVR